ncbi:MAG: BatA domain-containing protein [Terriglobales bacterium]
MGFFAPWFLFGFAALAAPLYLHLLRRQTTNPKPFSSLMFFEPRTQSSMRHRRLRYLLLLALRLALLSLLALAFAQPFILRPAASLASNHLTLLVLDRSFSMRAGPRFAAAQRQAQAALASLPGQAQAQVMGLGSALEILTPATNDAARLRAALAAITPGYSRADLGELARGIKQISETHPAPITLHFFSDLQRTSLPASFSDLLLPANVTLVLHPAVTQSLPNWTVETVSAPAELWGSPRETKPARVEAVVAGFGTPAARRSVSLSVNGKTVATQTVTLPASGRAAVVFDSVVFPYGWSRGVVRLDPPDAFPDDDAAFFTVRRADPQHVLFVRNAGDTRSPLFFGAALGVGDQAAAFTLDTISAGAASDPQYQTGRQLARYAFVVLSDLPSLPAGFESALGQYVHSGGSLFIAAGLATHSLPVFGGAIAASLNYGEHPMAVASSDRSHPSTALLADWPGARFYFANRITSGNARVLARLSDQTPLLFDLPVGEGRVEVFASGLDNLTNNFPLLPTFVPFVRETAGYLAGNADDAGGSRAVDSFLTLRSAKEQEVAVAVTDPQGRRPFSLDQATKAQTLALTQMGFYQLRLANGREQVVAVNPDRRESDLTLIPQETLDLWRGAPGESAPGTAPSSDAAPVHAAPAQLPFNLWWYVMLVMLAAALVESVVAARYLSVRRDAEEEQLELTKEAS